MDVAVAKLKRIFSINPKLTISDGLQRMEKCMLIERLPTIYTWDSPHDFDITYGYERYRFILDVISAIFAPGVDKIIYGYVIGDISFTKINISMPIAHINIVGNMICDTTINIWGSNMKDIIFYNVSIADATLSTFINCTFINTNIKSANRVNMNNCKLLSCVMGNISRSRLTSTHLERCAFRRAEIRQCTLIGCTMKKITVVRCDVYMVKIIGSKLHNWRVMSTTFVSPILSMSSIKLLIVARHSRLDRLVMRNCNLSDIFLYNVTLLSSVFSHCDIFQMAAIKSIFDRCSMRGSITDMECADNIYKRCQFAKINIYHSPIIVHKYEEPSFIVHNAVPIHI